MSLQDRKKNSKNNLAQLQKEIEKLSKPQYDSTDERFWRPAIDKAGNGSAVIRFLDSPADESCPWVKFWEHGFKGPTGQWYIEKSLTTLGQQDPVSEVNSKLWNTGDDDSKQIARNQKRKLRYISNILVIKDPANPQNEGKVFLFQYGKKIFDKINEILYPEQSDPSDTDVKAINPFDFWEGANFRLKIKTIAEFLNYDASKFDPQSALFDGDDEQIEKVFKSEYKLNEFIDPKTFKSYDELKKRLDLVLGLNETEKTEKVQKTSKLVATSNEEDVEEEFDEEIDSDEFKALAALVED